MGQDLTKGPITKNMLLFAGPMILGNLLQQLYNIADTLIVSWFLGPEALGAVGSAYTLMVFLTSVFIGLCMGSGTLFSMDFGRGQEEKLRNSIFVSFVLIGGVTVVINILVFALLHPILWLLQVPQPVYPFMEEYVRVIFLGLFFVFLYNFFAFLLRAVGNSVTPLYFLMVSAALNILLDLLFVVVFSRGVAGAALATVISQAVAGIGLGIYCFLAFPKLRPLRKDMAFPSRVLRQILAYSLSTSLQQSVMNFGILAVQSLINSFGPVVMAAYAAAVKIDSFAYMPLQEFSNAFSTYTAQNYGAGKGERIRRGIRSAALVTLIFSLLISLLIFLFAPYLMGVFVDGKEKEIIEAGVLYLRIEGAFYLGIGCLFLLYGLYRAVGRPMMSVVLTVISLGLRVALAYSFSAVEGIGEAGIWWAIPIGWVLADMTGILYFRRKKEEILSFHHPQRRGRTG